MTKSFAKKVSLLVFFLMTLFLFAVSSHAVPYKAKDFSFKQPNGSLVQVKVTGDEFYQRVESTDGYTLVRDPQTGYICYAKIKADGSDFESTGIAYTGGSFPAAQVQAAPGGTAVQKGLKLSGNVVKQKVRDAKASFNHDDILKSASAAINRPAASAQSSQQGLSMATVTPRPIKGLTILIDFPDQQANITQAQIDNMLNQQNYTGFSNNGSVRDYYYGVSGGAIEYTNLVTAYYRAQYNKSYYDDATKDCGTQGRLLITEALDYLKSIKFDFSTLTLDASNNIVSLNVMYAGSPTAGWSHGLWPHQWYVNYSGSLMTSKTVYARNYEITNIGTDLAIGTFCHENGHMLFGWPDTYDYGYESNGAGNYDLMAAMGSEKNPVPPNPYFRCVLSGWGTLRNITSIENYCDVNVAANDTGAIIAYAPYTLHYDPQTGMNIIEQSEFFMIENIRKTGRRTYMPDEGLLIWHIDKYGSNDNEQMTAASHYMVSVEQADGANHLETSASYGSDGDLFHAGYRTRFDVNSTPNSRWWNGSDSGLMICGISNIGDTMTFRKYFPGSTTSAISYNPGVNAALNKPASASYYVSNEPPANAVNGTYSSLHDKWCTGYNQGANSWLMVDMGTPTVVSRWLVVHEKGRPGADQRMFTKSFKLQYSLDGETNWTDLDAVYNNTEGITDRTISGATARFYRLYIIEPDFDTAVRIYEFQLYSN